MVGTQLILAVVRKNRINANGTHSVALVSSLVGEELLSLKAFLPPVEIPNLFVKLEMVCVGILQLLRQ